jgi:hypothetical protein
MSPVLTAPPVRLAARSPPPAPAPKLPHQFLLRRQAMTSDEPTEMQVRLRTARALPNGDAMHRRARSYLSVAVSHGVGGQVRVGVGRRKARKRLVRSDSQGERRGRSVVLGDARRTTRARRQTPQLLPTSNRSRFGGAASRLVRDGGVGHR